MLEWSKLRRKHLRFDALEQGLMSNSQNQPASRDIPSLEDDMRAEFDQCWLDPAFENKITQRQIDAIEIALDHAGQSLPQAYRADFVGAALEKMNAKFHRNYRGITSDQFHEAIGLIAEHIVEYRERFNIRELAPNTEHGRWRAFLNRLTRSEIGNGV